MKTIKKPMEGAVCNLCCNKFRRKSIYIRYCEDCRQESELYRFADCWPTA